MIDGGLASNLQLDGLDGRAGLDIVLVRFGLNGGIPQRPRWLVSRGALMSVALFLS